MASGQHGKGSATVAGKVRTVNSIKKCVIDVNARTVYSAYPHYIGMALVITADVMRWQA